MPPGTAAGTEWLSAPRRYLVASAALRLVWEIVQLPLYTIGSEPLPNQAFAVLHCTVGDVMIAALSLLATLTLINRPDWPRTGARPVWLVVLLFGVGYTLYSEGLNVNVRGNWAYSTWMPTLPVVGTGLAPLLQWLLVPTLAQQFALGHAPWRSDRNSQAL